MLEDIRIVLVETTHPGNIGAAARAMKNMGLTRLFLVKPHHYPDHQAIARAAGAGDVLEDARICDSLDQAVAGCSMVFGASARSRSIPWPQLDPRQAAERAMHSGEVAFVFGREHAGLTNLELDRCNYLVTIPTDPDFASLNVAAAVQVLSYELRVAAQTGMSRTMPGDPLASAAERERFYQHLERVLLDLEFLNPDNPKHLMRRLRRLFNRIEIDRNEVNILRGILTAVERRSREKNKGQTGS